MPMSESAKSQGAQCWICPQCYDDKHHDPGDIHCLRQRNAELEVRVAELESHADRMLAAIKANDFALDDPSQYEADKLLFDSTEDYLIFKEDNKSSEPFLLRVQAEALEQEAELIRNAAQNSAKRKLTLNAIAKVMTDRAKESATKQTLLRREVSNAPPMDNQRRAHTARNG